MRFLARTLGHRGAVLGLLGLIWVLIGVSLIPGATNPRSADQLLLFTHIPLPLRVAMWTVTGGVALVCAWLRGPGRDTPGFALLIVPAIIRAGSFAWSWLAWLVTDGRMGGARGWTGAVVWAAIVGVILITASWREPAGFAPPHEPESEQEGGEHDSEPT